MSERRPRKRTAPPPGPKEQAKREIERHASKEAGRIVQEANKRKKQITAEADALIETGHLMSAPRGTNYYDEHKRNREIAEQVHDLALQTKRVSIAYNENGEGGAFLMSRTPKSFGLIQQFVAAIGRLLGRPVDTNHVDLVKERQP